MADADPAAAQAAGALISVGRIGRAHGLDGSFYVTRPRERVLGGAVAVIVDGAEVAIVRHDGTPSRPILRLEGVSVARGGRRACAGPTSGCAAPMRRRWTRTSGTPRT